MLDRQYRDEALKLEPGSISSLPKSVGWESPANIALVKYWGKKEEQKPINPSLSMTLSSTHTKTEVHYTRTRNDEGQRWFRFNGEENTAFTERVTAYINRLQPYFPFLKHLDLYIDSWNTFPHSAGMASSASSMSALALSICTIEQRMKQEKSLGENFYRKASFMARLGSGSASRSVYGNYVEWGNPEDGANEYAQPLQGKIHERFNLLHDSVMITSARAKKVKSSQGHTKMDDHPYRKSRIEQAVKNLKKLQHAIASGDFNTFCEATEEEALSLHGLMLSSRPGFTLLNEAAISIINEIRAFRESRGTPITFTLDAGPNVHVIYPVENKEAIRDWIDQKLKAYCENGRMIHDFTGKGPELLDRNRNG